MDLRKIVDKKNEWLKLSSEQKARACDRNSIWRELRHELNDPLAKMQRNPGWLPYQKAASSSNAMFCILNLLTLCSSESTCRMGVLLHASRVISHPKALEMTCLAHGFCSAPYSRSPFRHTNTICSINDMLEWIAKSLFLLNAMSSTC